MSSSNVTLKLDPERIKEMPMVDLAFEVLKSANTPYYYRDLMMEIAKIRGLSTEGINQFIAQVYTEINIDGRFACVGSNMWGLKRWYPVERSEDPVGNAKRTRIINDDDDLEDDEVFADEEDDSFAEQEEDYDVFDEDREDFEEAEEETEVDEEVDVNDDELEEEEIDGELDSDEGEEDVEEELEDEDNDK